MKKIVVILFACLLSVYSFAQNMFTVFAEMPRELNILVDSIQRQDLMDLYKNGSPAKVKDRLNETVTLSSFNEDYLELHSGNFSAQIALLKLINDSKIICLIQTVCAPVCDSKLSFYTSEWKILDTADFVQPVEVSWFLKDDVDKNNQDFIHAIKSLDMNLMQYRFDSETLSLSQIFTTPQYLSKGDKEAVEPFLKNEDKVFEWKKMGFK